MFNMFLLHNDAPHTPVPRVLQPTHVCRSCELLSSELGLVSSLLYY